VQKCRKSSAGKAMRECKWCEEPFGRLRAGEDRKVKMTLFAFRGAKIHEWTFYDPIKLSSLGNDV
jgi:hypothetical protein